MKDLFLMVVEISISTGLIILLMVIFSSYMNKKYAAKWKYLIWILIAVRLIVPLNFGLPVQKIVVDVPTQITAPINVNVANAVPLALQAEHKAASITLVDIAAYLWLIGCVLFLMVHIFSFIHFRKRIIKDGIEVEDERILSLICRLSGELRIKPDIQVVRYSGAGSPMIVGFFNPLLVLPDYSYSEEELFFILKHELIHLKRKDIYFKLLFVIANAIHWFNPLVYFMQKEAEIDMELSCDERVLYKAPYAVREAYTETLLATLSRQYKRGNTFTTQFYGGKNFMKKRFHNILNKSKKRNGVIVSICVICLMFVSGMLVGCFAVVNISSGVQMRSGTGNSGMQTDVSDIQIKNSDMQTKQDILEDRDAVKEAAKEQENSIQNMENGDIAEPTLSDDAEQMKELVEEFANAYFGGDMNGVKSLLPASYAWDVEVYEGMGAISDVTVKGLPDGEEQAEGSVWTVTLEYRDSTYEDMFQYLTFELMKQGTGWEIQFYGIEG